MPRSGNDRGGETAGDLRLRRRSGGELFSDIPSGRATKCCSAMRKKDRTPSPKRQMLAIQAQESRREYRDIALSYRAREKSVARNPHIVRAYRQRAQCSARHRTCRPRLQHRLAHCLRDPSIAYLSRITIVTRGTPMVLERSRVARPAGPGASRRRCDGGSGDPARAAMVVRGKDEHRMEGVASRRPRPTRVIDDDGKRFVFEITGLPRKSKASST